MTLRQPFLHDLAVVLRAPTQVWSAPNGDVDGSGVQGAFFGDHRVLRGLGVDVQDAEGAVELASAGASLRPDGSVDFHTVVRWQDGTADPLGALTRHRVAHPGGFGERIVISASLPRPIEVTLTVRLVPDNTPLNLIKAGVEAARPVTLQGNGWTFGAGASATLDAPAATIEHDEAITLRWRLTLPAFGQVAAQWSLALRDPATPFVGSAAAPLAAPALTNASSSLARLVAQSLADLSSLRLCERNEADRTFFAAGAPWFLTLFGRDSLIAARLLLPADTEMAVGTLRTLAGRQGTAVDVDRAEQPGKILHEVRAATLDLQQGTVLPPEYYGTVDATPLWVLLLADAVAAGVDPVAEGLMDGLHGALTWLRDHSDPDGDGFAEYYDTSGHGLANQGWKTRATRSASPTDGSPTARSPWSRCRATATRQPSRAPSCWRDSPTTRPGPRSGVTGRPDSRRGSTSSSGCRTPTAATLPWPSIGRRTRSPAWRPTWVTCWAPACWTPTRRPWW